MKKTIVLLLSSILISACSTNTQTTGSNQTYQTEPTLSVSATSTPSSSPTRTPSRQNQEDVVSLKTKYGEVLLKLYTKESPNTVKNFLSKVESGFYNGLTFHRVEPGFVVQGGDPKGNGTGGGTIKSEINSIPFKRGSLGLARGGVKEISNDSQFYICLATETCSHLSGEYVNFGEVISGMEAIDSIQKGDQIQSFSASTK